jgi:hypothetical protein
MCSTWVLTGGLADEQARRRLAVRAAARDQREDVKLARWPHWHRADADKSDPGVIQVHLASNREFGSLAAMLTVTVTVDL